MKVVLREVPKELRGGTYITVDELAPHGDESAGFLVNDEVFCHAGGSDRTGTARIGHGYATRLELSRDQTQTMMSRWIRMTLIWR